MDFGKALAWLKSGEKVRRAGWNGKGMFLYMSETSLPRPPEYQPDIASLMSTFIIIKTADEKLIPWLASQSDVLAHDWELA